MSDILTYSWGPSGTGSTQITGTFTSDSETPLGTLPIDVSPRDVFVETPGLIVPFSAPFLGGEILPDGDIPEPASLFLMGTGLAGLLLGWSRKRATRHVS